MALLKASSLVKEVFDDPNCMPSDNLLTLKSILDKFSPDLREAVNRMPSAEPSRIDDGDPIGASIETNSHILSPEQSFFRGGLL